MTVHIVSEEGRGGVCELVVGSKGANGWLKGDCRSSVDVQSVISRADDRFWRGECWKKHGVFRWRRGLLVESDLDYMDLSRSQTKAC